KASGLQGLVTVSIPAGKHTLDVWYGGTRDQHLATAASGVGLLICGLLLTAHYLLIRVEKSPPCQRGGDLGAGGAAEQRFAQRLAVVLVLWLAFNQWVVIPHTEWFRPRGAVDAPWGMQTRVGERFFEPGIGYRLELIGYTLDDEDLTLYWRLLG